MVETPNARCDVLIEAGWVVPVVPHGVVLEDHAVAITGDAIIAVGPTSALRARFTAKETLSRPDAVLLPGLVNAHTHNPMTLLRGIADDLPLMEWLQGHIWPVEGAVMGPEFVRDGVTLAIAEMLRGGTTCANENYFFPDVQAETYKRHGFRALVGLPVIDFPTAWATTSDEYFGKAADVHAEWQGDALVGTTIAPHAPYTVSDANFVRAGVTLAIAEMLRGGTTCANENYFFPDVQAETYRRHGFRALVGLPVIDFPTAWASTADEYFGKAQDVHDGLHGDALVGSAIAPHAPYTVSDANFVRVREFAQRNDVRVHLCRKARS